MASAISRTFVIYPSSICETRSGNFAHTVGRIAFKPGRPMLVEHVGGLYLEHELSGKVKTKGYGDDYDIVHIFEPEKAE